MTARMNEIGRASVLQLTNTIGIVRVNSLYSTYMAACNILFTIVLTTSGVLYLMSKMAHN